MKNIRLFINGQWLEKKERYFVEDPFSNETIASVSKAAKEDIKAAIQSAEKAQQIWESMTVYERSDSLKKIAALIKEQRSTLAQVMTEESGKTITDAYAEVDASRDIFCFYAEEVKRIFTQVIPSRVGNQQMVIKEPLGVVALITPWNFPLNLVARKLAPALAAGNAVLLKPSSETPLSAYKLIELCEKAGLIKGLVNFLPSDSREFTKEIMKSPTVRKISFTGSTKIGQQLYQESSKTLKHLSLELGGNAPFIVLEDADLELSSGLLIKAKKRNNGQVCTSPNRVFVHESILAPFIAKLTAKSQQLKVGDPTDETTDIGPLINQKAVEKIKNLLADAREKGATSLVENVTFDRPNLIGMQILKDVTPQMSIYQEEIFGPVISIISFQTIDEVIQKANETEYGLAAYLFGKKSKVLNKVVRALKFGLVGVNEIVVATTETPFGGMKYSGFGRENGTYGLEEYQEIKFVNYREEE